LDSNNVDELKTLELTELGHRMAVAFGHKLPIDKPVRVFYSPIKRTKQTAEGIVKGLEEVNGDVRLERRLCTLLGPMGNPDRFISLSLKIGFANFFNKWILGEIDPAILEPLDTYVRRLVPMTLGELSRFDNDVVHIHVTHDLVIMTARFAFFGIETNNESLIPYLGGFGISKKNEEYLGYERRRPHKLKSGLF
jgi:broad specificity phosphatase PhoE